MAKYGSRAFVHNVSGKPALRAGWRAGWALLALTCWACVAAAQPADLLLYSPFDGTAGAAIARGGGENLGDAAPGFSDGMRGQALVLQSDCLYPTAGNFDPRAGTLAAWVRPHWSGDDPAGHYLFCIYGHRELPQPWSVNRWSVQFAGGLCTFTIFSEVVGETFSLSAPIDAWEAGTWHHVACTWSGVNSGAADARMRLYLDGVAVAEAVDRDIRVGPMDEVLAIGRDQDASPDYGDADVDDLYIYGRALRGDEIAAGYEAVTSGAPYEQAAGAEEAKPVPGWWDSRFSYRAPVAPPPDPPLEPGQFVQAPVHLSGDLAQLGEGAGLNARSVRVVDGDGRVLPSRLEDGLLEWQVAAADARYEIYFQVDRYQIESPLVSRRLVAPEEAPPEPPPAPDYATETYGRPWDFSDGTFSGIDQWGNRPEFVQNRRVVDGVLHMDVQDDPWFIWGDMWGQVDETNRRVAIDMARYPILEMRVRQSVPSAKWTLYARQGTSTALVHYDFTVRGTHWQRVRVDLRKEARFTGVLSAFRIDPTNDVEAHVEIDWVRLSAVRGVEHGRVETLGRPGAVAARVDLAVPATRALAGLEQEATITVLSARGAPVSGQPVVVALKHGSGGTLAAAQGQSSLELSPTSRRGLTDTEGKLRVKYAASRRAAENADTLVATPEFCEAKEARVAVTTVPGPPDHYLVEPAKVATLTPDRLPLRVTATLVDQYGNATAPEGAPKLSWSTEEGATVQAVAGEAAPGTGSADWTGDESVRWVYRARVADDRGYEGQSAEICLLPAEPRRDPIVLGDSGYFRRGEGGPAWLPLGGFYANWVGLPEGGEEGRRLVSFVDATEEQLVHWLQFLADQGVTGLRFMLRAHTPKGMEPMDVIGRVNMPLFARILRYMDLARKHDIKFLLVIHEDYTKPAYYNRQALETFCLPRYAGEDLDALPPHQRRFVRDGKLIETIAEKYTDPDVMACQDQYARQIVGLLADNPQLFGWEFENEMVDCPASWIEHAAEVIRSVDPVTPICASHGGGGLHTADPLWWTTQTPIDFYTYHLYPHRGSTSETMDYGLACDVLTCYGRMAGVCMFGEAAGDEFSRYPAERSEDRRYLMRDIIWFGLVNGNPGCFFWNARGIEVEQFRLAAKITAGLDWTTWKRQKPEVGIVVSHPVEDDKYYRTPEGIADYWMMGRYADHLLSDSVDFDVTMSPEGYEKTADLESFVPLFAAGPLKVSRGFQVRTNAREGYAEGLAYVRNVGGVRNWQAERIDMFIRDRRPARLVLRLDLPLDRARLTITDLDTGDERREQVPGRCQLELGETEHDFAIVWQGPE